MEFSASYDRTAGILSGTVCGILVLTAAGTQSLIVAGIGAALVLLAYSYSPRSYTLSGDSLTISRLIGDVRIPVGEIREARRATGGDFDGCIRLMGSGGLFGYYGRYRTTRLGKCRWFVTKRQNAVIVKTADQTIVLSPDDPEGLLDSLHVPAQPGDVDQPFSQTIGSLGSGSKGSLIAAAAIGAALGLIPLAMLYSPGPDSYTLTSQTLTIHDRFYPVTLRSNEVDVDGIREIDLGTDAQWRPTLRTNGFSNSHYHSGWYRVAGGQKIRLYRTDGWRLVLLPPRNAAGTPVLYQPPDLEQFLADVRREWGGS